MALFWGAGGPGEGGEELAGTGQLVGGVRFEGGGFWDVASLGGVCWDSNFLG